MANIIASPTQSTQPVGSTLQNDFTGPNGEKLVSDVHGRFFNVNYRGGLFTFNVAAVTLPVNAGSLASKFGIYNPPSSGKNMELVCMDAASVVATTVVDAIGLYYSSGSTAAAATFTTPGTILSSIVGGNAASVVTAYTAVSHSGTPALHSILTTWGATTAATQGTNHYDFDGRIIVPPGTLISLAMTTAASTASGITLGLTWAEFPV